MRFPPYNQITGRSEWNKDNKSDIGGALVGTFNINLSKKESKLHVTRMIQTSSQTGFNGLSANSDLSDFPAAFKYFNNGGSTKIWTISGTRLHNSGSAVPYASFTVDATSGTPTTCSSLNSDMEVFNGYLYVTTYSGGSGDKLYKLNGTWSSNSTGLGSAAGAHMLVSYAARLYISVSGGTAIYSMNTSDVIATSGTYTLSLPSSERIVWMRASSNRIWIGVNVLGGKGLIHEWDGASTNVTRTYRLEASGSWACVIKNDYPWVIDSNGKLLAYANGTFIEYDSFPISDKLLTNINNSENNRPVHPNGISLINGKIHILLNNVIEDTSSSIEEFCPSGIWEHHPQLGLYHKYSLSYLAAGSNTIKDYGQNRICVAGALSEMKVASTADNATGDFIAGATIYTNASSTDVGIFTNDTFEATSGTTGRYSTDGSGYIVTKKIVSENVEDTWQKVYLYYKKLLTSSGKITLKYRTYDIKPTEATITWISTNSFVTSTDVSAYVVGDEVEVTQGTGSGLCSHITAIQAGAGPSYIVTLDEMYTGATGTAKARFQKWTKVLPQVNEQISQSTELTIGEKKSWIQFKVCMIFKNMDEFEAMDIVNEVNKPIA